MSAMIGAKRKAHGVIDRELIVFETDVDGPVAASGPLLTKWADYDHLTSNRECVIERATPTKREVWEKCCYTPMSLWVCQTLAADAQAVLYEIIARDEANVETVVSAFTVTGMRETVHEFNNAVVIDGEELYHKNLSVRVTLNGDPIETVVWFGVGNC